MLARNSSSSRAIPANKSIQAVLTDPFMPEAFGLNEPGMVASRLLNDEATLSALEAWNDALERALESAQTLAELEVHKGLTNRILEPYKWHTAIITGTDWSNFFALRTDVNTQPEFRKIALMMQEQYQKSEPSILGTNEWHLPLISIQEWRYWLAEQGHLTASDYATRVSVGRCARTSYLTHHGVRDPEADIELASKLAANGHVSPFEHPATPFTRSEWRHINQLTEWITEEAISDQITSHEANRIVRNLQYDGNLKGWHSARSYLPNQHDFSLVKETQDVT
jgi:hypothetical protein